MSVKVMSQNVMSWEYKEIGKFCDRRPLMKKAVLDHGADVIGFQEVIPVWKEYFDEDLKDYEYILKYRRETNLEATPIYWNPKKVTKLDSGYFWLSETPDVESLGWDAKCYRITCWVLFKENETGKQFAFVNTHLDHRGEKARINGITQICEFITNKFGSDMPLVLTGDFNAQPDSSVIKKADSLLVDARAKAKSSTDKSTFHGYENLDAIIDYIYLSNNIDCVDFDIVTEQNGEIYQSDHRGIIATINL